MGFKNPSKEDLFRFGFYEKASTTDSINRIVIFMFSGWLISV